MELISTSWKGYATKGYAILSVYAYATNLSVYATNISVYATKLSVCATKLSVYETKLSVYETNLSVYAYDCRNLSRRNKLKDIHANL